MPQHLDGPVRAGLIAEVVTRLLAEGGQAAVTTRAVADGAGVGLSSLAHHFGGRRRLMSVSCHLAGRAHLWRVWDRIDALGVGGFLADDEESLALDRAWLAWTDLARFDDHLSHHVWDTETRETYAVGQVLGEGAAQDDVEILAAAARGLRAAVCRLEDPLPPGQGRRLLEHLVQALTRDTAV